MPIATLIEYDDSGKVTARPIRLRVNFCKNNEPPIVEIALPDRIPTRHRSLQITPRQIRNLLRDISGP